MFSNDPQKSALAELLRPIFATDVVPPANDSQPVGTQRPSSAPARELRAVLLSYDGAILAGHVMLDLLEENGYGPLDIDILTVAPENLPLALAIQHAAASRGLAYDVVTQLDGALIGPDATGRTAVAIKLYDDEPAAIPDLPVAATAALIGTTLASYTENDLMSGEKHD
ncbi:hypothetical protein [Arcanobacterium phocae]|uniref:hypothetical protein n=1 Tax=Arcanobacterium phocae TaxID=131112 RepID=UPI001C0F9DB9|nr:hypothetical protein [Arcanobacterium phocae]